MSRARGAAPLAILAALAACSPVTREQVLHVRVTMSGSRIADAQGQPVQFEHGDVFGWSPQEGYRNGSAMADKLVLALDAPVHASRPDEPFLLAPSARAVPTFEGGVRLYDVGAWSNVDSGTTVHVDMARHWPRGTLATAPGAAVRAEVVSIAGGGLAAEIDADLRLAGEARDSRYAFGRGFDAPPESAWKDCNLSTVQARCTLALQMSTLPLPSGRRDPDREAASVTWNRELRGMRVTWNADGTFVARADGEADDPGADGLHVIHVLMWTSAPEDSREPPASAPRSPTIDP